MSLDAAIARLVFGRDDYRCRHCHWIGDLHPHHVLYKSQGGTDKLNNLLSLCAQCHRAHHDGFLKIDILEVLEYDLVIRFHRQKGWKPA